MGISNCSALSGPWGKAAGRIFSQFWPYLLTDLQVLFSLQRIWLQHHSQCKETTKGHIHPPLSQVKLFPMPYLDSFMPYLGTSTITCKVGKKETGTLSSCKMHGWVCEQEWRLPHLFPLERLKVPHTHLILFLTLNGCLNCITFNGKWKGFQFLCWIGRTQAPNLGIKSEGTDK